MKAKAFNFFCEEVQAASVTSTVWRFAEYWDGMTNTQRAAMAEILDVKPEVGKIDRYGTTFYLFPTGREWTV